MTTSECFQECTALFDETQMRITEIYSTLMHRQDSLEKELKSIIQCEIAKVRIEMEMKFNSLEGRITTLTNSLNGGCMNDQSR